MAVKKNIATEMEVVLGLESLATAYQEISVMKMREIRNSVVLTRTFMDGLSGVFFHVTSSYKHQLEDLMKKNRKDGQVLQVSTLPKNGKEAIVLLSANTKLYGEIIPKTFFAFLEKAEKTTADIFIVGALGRELFDQQAIKKKYTYITLPDNLITPEDMQKIVDTLIVYQSVNVFYGKFENVVTQIPEARIVSGQQQIDATESPSDTLRFYFEPSLKTILNFFETQIFSGLFRQTVHENQLARYASRITAMESALNNVHKRIDELQRKGRLARHATENKKQLSSLAGRNLWKR